MMFGNKEGKTMTDENETENPGTEGEQMPEGLGALLGMLAGMKKPEDVDFESEMGGDVPLDEPDVDISLKPSRAVPVAGELWSISGIVSNRSTKPVWIVDKSTDISLSPEMYGQSSQTGSIGAFFPTIESRPFAEVVRIDPGASYSVIWKIDPVSTKDNPGSTQSIYKRILNALRNYSFFNPGEFVVSANVHIWQKKPSFSKQGNVTNIGDSYVKNVTSQVEMESSPWVLIIGAAIGGILCFVLQMLFGAINLGDSYLSIIKGVLVGFSSAVILSGVVTVLLSRLATTDFLIVVKIKDIWGAIATGFVVQWFGFPVLERILTSIGAPGA